MVALTPIMWAMKREQNDMLRIERARVGGFRVVVRAPVKVSTSILLCFAVAVSCAFGVLSGIWLACRTIPPPRPRPAFRTTDPMPARIEEPKPAEAQVVMLI
jgi:hypothetical protein